ncbi:phasin family protein [Bradyrhizobium sp. CB1650]|uniref:phasin family protein n=1 Tax=Bradyrhizobium sp. CB1650 TaxID=3039153 RepID=UPI002435100D|nr:phasin family protein [Bradyrhizobium sp. CB1650]WGD50988.1 phasin family protein [Bradyrhizobium sp. CB1650]WGD51623.1 phasin family protein [Bradyrhizobium sp. CB1650]
MAHPRQEEKTAHSAEETVRRTGEKAAEQTRRIGLAATQVGDEIAQVSANLFQQNAEMLQNTWRLEVDMATTVFSRSLDQLGRPLGLSGQEAQGAIERSARNAHTILQFANAVTKGMNEISREYFDFVRHRFENNMDHMNELWRCRNAQEIAALHTEVARDTVASVLESGRRMADMSLRVVDDAKKPIAESMGRAA